MESAVEWGERHKSCKLAMEQRRALGPDATQAVWYRVCDRGDWLLWQLERHPQWHEIQPVVRPVVDRIIARAIRHGVKSLRRVRSEEATAYLRWARRWLIGEDRSQAAAAAATRSPADAAARNAASAAADAAFWAAADAAAWAGADAAQPGVWAAELHRQAREIHAVIPEWPNEEG